MTTFSAIQKERSATARRIVIVVYPGVTLLDAAGPAQAFWSANEVSEAGAQHYEVILTSPKGGGIATDTGIVLDTISLRKAERRGIDTLLVAGGLGVMEAANDEGLKAWIRDRAIESRRIGSTCMGAFLIAAADILAGRKATTHWRWCDELQRRHPSVDVQMDSIFVRDGNIWSSAGVTAGIDLALAMIEEDCGHSTSLKVAQSLVVYLRRPGGQAQFSTALAAQSAEEEGRFSSLHAWILEHLDTDLKIESLAARVGMSPRTFARAYRVQIGTTPAKVVEGMRIEKAKRLLERATLSVGQVARRCGFGGEERMRRAFLRTLNISPYEYRQRFSVRPMRGPQKKQRTLTLG